MDFKISFKKIQKEITGASGLVKCGGFYYVLGDDSPFLFKLDTQFDIISKYPIHTIDSNYKNGRIAKSKKPDFEALEAVGENEMIGLGSGSKSPEREQCIRIALGSTISVSRYSLAPFYGVLKAMEILKGMELNIEAAAYAGGTLYLFNRGKNLIFGFDYENFLAFLNGGSACPPIACTECKLPGINGIEAGFSGAAVDHANETIIVTSSVENTKNAYDDGEVLGSFVGICPLAGNQLRPITWVPVHHGGQPLKIESVAVDLSAAEGNLELVLAADNDDGQSLFLRGELRR